MDEQNKAMAAFYDEMAIRNIVTGEYIHHGYYGPGEHSDVSSNKAAERRMVDEVLKFAGVSDDPTEKPKNIIDVGCGYGGVTLYLAKKYGANCIGTNLSTAQNQKAKDLAAAVGLGDKTSFVIADALNQPFPDGQFDLVWSMEVSENTPNKLKFISEMARIAAPEATIIFTLCCQRDLSPGENSLKPDEKNLMDKITKPPYAFPFISPSDTVKIFQSLALQDIKMADFTENVIPYFRAKVQSQWTWQGLVSMLLNGWAHFKLSQSQSLTLKAYEKNVTRYIVIACRKPK